MNQDENINYEKIMLQIKMSLTDNNIGKAKSLIEKYKEIFIWDAMIYSIEGIIYTYENNQVISIVESDSLEYDNEDIIVYAVNSNKLNYIIEYLIRKK